MKEQSECPRGWGRIDCTAMIDGIDTEKEISWRNSMNHETPGKECRKVLIMGLRQSLVPCNRCSEWENHTILGRSVRRWASCPGMVLHQVPCMGTSFLGAESLLRKWEMETWWMKTWKFWNQMCEILRILVQKMIVGHLIVARLDWICSSNPLG